MRPGQVWHSDGNLGPSMSSRSRRDGGERERITDETDYFDRPGTTWPGVITQPLPESARAEIVSAADARHVGLTSSMRSASGSRARSPAGPPRASKLGEPSARPHQVSALMLGLHGRRGLFEHATGSGKTFTALCAMNDSFRRATSAHPRPERSPAPAMGRRNPECIRRSRCPTAHVRRREC